MKNILWISVVLFAQFSFARNLYPSPMTCKVESRLASSNELPQDGRSNILYSALSESREQTDNCPDLISIMKASGSKLLMPLTEANDKICQYELATSSEKYSVKCILDGTGLL